MQTDWMDYLEKVLASHRRKGLLSYLIYAAIFLGMAMYVLLKPLFNFLTFNKLKRK